MPIPDLDEAYAYAAGICFKHGPPTLIGVELEFTVHDADDPRCPIHRSRLTSALGPYRPPALDPSAPVHRSLPHGALVTVEPGGQVELSGTPAPSLGECLASTADDLDVLRAALAGAGLALGARGADPYRPPVRVLDHPRYVAMERHLDDGGRAGRYMMGSTASVQVCVDAGTDGDATAGPAVTDAGTRWLLAHRLGPVLVAMFANSPVLAGRRTGWVSSRQAVWRAVDPARTAPPWAADPRTGVGGAGEAAEAYAAWALAAPLMCRRQATGSWQVGTGTTLAQWISDAAGRSDSPTFDDLDYHLTTLFPPVRPRGHLELRYLDTQPGDGWQVVAAVVSALLDDPRAADAALEVSECTAGRWLDAARVGLADPELGRVAKACLSLAREALDRRAVSTTVRDAVGAFADRYTDRGQCPADDRLELRAEEDA
jgi:glutamate--cysteine ligase